MKFDEILICIFNYFHDDNARRWLKLLSPYFDVYVLDSGNTKTCNDFIQYPNIYYSGLWNEMKKMSVAKKYRWVGIICSDVLMDEKFDKKMIDKIITMSYSSNVGVWTLLGDLRGHSNRYVYGMCNKHHFRIFEGFFQFIRIQVLNNIDYIDTKINLYGHGIDYLTCYMSNFLGYINRCDEDVEIIHPNVKGYNRISAVEQGTAFKRLFYKRYADYMKGIIEHDGVIPSYECNTEYSNRKCVYTCITGDYDVLGDIRHEEGWDYICFTDMDIYTDSWEIRRIPKELDELSNVKKQRMVKVLPHKFLSEYAETIWIDANINLAGSINEYYKLCRTYETPIVFKLHPIRNCIYAEMDACIKYGKDTKQKIETIRKRYNEEGMPQNDGMYETGVIYRYNYDARANILMNKWAEEIIDNSHRDQLSLNYCIWKLDDYDLIYGISNTIVNKYFSIHSHIKNTYLYYKEDISALIDNNTKTKEEKVSGNRLLVLIEKSQYNPILSGIYNSFSELYDTKIIDCPNRNYVKCYKELSGYSKLYDWILLLKSNVSFEWASSKYFKTIINKLTNITYRNDVGLFGLNNSHNADGVITGGEIKTIITQDQFVLINTKVIDECRNVVFSNDMGFGYIDYLSKISNRIGLSTIMCLDIPMRTYTNVENYDNPTVSDYRKKFMKDNPL